MLLFDNNLSPKLVRLLQSEFPNCAHVADFGLEDKDDQTVWRFAKANGYDIVTKDKDFLDLQIFQGFPPKIIKLNCGNATTSTIFSILKKEQLAILNFLSDKKLGVLELR